MPQSEEPDISSVHESGQPYQDVSSIVFFSLSGWPSVTVNV